MKTHYKIRKSNMSKNMVGSDVLMITKKWQRLVNVISYIKLFNGWGITKYSFLEEVTQDKKPIKHFESYWNDKRKRHEREVKFWMFKWYKYKFVKQKGLPAIEKFSLFGGENRVKRPSKDKNRVWLTQSEAVEMFGSNKLTYPLEPYGYLK